MELGDLVYSVNMGAFCATSSTCVNGFPPAEVVYVYQLAEVLDETTGSNNASPAREAGRREPMWRIRLCDAPYWQQKRLPKRSFILTNFMTKACW
jgi:hypothetical protein